MEKIIENLQCSIEDAFKALNVECVNNGQEDNDTSVFDKYGNYTFPTETSFSAPNCLLSVSKYNF